MNGRKSKLCPLQCWERDSKSVHVCVQDTGSEMLSYNVTGGQLLSLLPRHFMCSDRGQHLRQLNHTCSLLRTPILTHICRNAFKHFPPSHFITNYNQYNQFNWQARIHTPIGFCPQCVAPGTD